MELASVDLNLLPVLAALLETESVTLAAERLGLSTSATSHALGRLRDQLGDPLLVRAGRRLVPTPRATAILPRVTAAMAANRAVFAVAESLDPATLARTFRLQTTDHVSLVLGPALDRALREQAPDVDLYLLPIAPDVSPLLRDGSIDAAVGVFPDAAPELRRRALFDDHFVCLVREDHPVVGETLDLETWLSLPHMLVSPRGRDGGLVDRVLAEWGRTRRVRRTVPQFLVAAFLLAQSDEVLTVSARIAASVRGLLPLRELSPPIALPHYTLQLLWHPRHDSDPAHRWLRERLVEVSAALA
jgi:DNA-binding transcriptional LysR family regulator